ncbi:ABC transporter permease [Enterococcus sp. LJL51]|uniref:ABC transporter permease n=1 Tax=Enterococcus sp. LJL51 TaxID=3416656 RepID=UPI003CEA5AF9
MHTVQDTMTMTGRVLKHTMKSIDTLITVVLMPVMIMLASVYIYGSAMDMGNKSYIDYVVPGILILTIITGSGYTAYRLTQDVTKGIFERFHSMPIAKSSILGGHVYTSVLYNFVSMFFVGIAALLFGYRMETSLLHFMLAFLLLLVFNFAMTWVAVFFGLLAKSVETASVYSYILMAFVFVSSAFAPIESMKSGLQIFAKYNPFTAVIDGLRELLSGNTLDSATLTGLIFSGTVWLVFAFGSVVVYKKKLK